MAHVSPSSSGLCKTSSHLSLVTRLPLGTLVFTQLTVNLLPTPFTECIPVPKTQLAFCTVVYFTLLYFTLTDRLRRLSILKLISQALLSTSPPPSTYAPSSAYPRLIPLSLPRQNYHSSGLDEVHALKMLLTP